MRLYGLCVCMCMCMCTYKIYPGLGASRRPGRRFAIDRRGWDPIAQRRRHRLRNRDPRRRLSPEIPAPARAEMGDRCRRRSVLAAAELGAEPSPHAVQGRRDPTLHDPAGRRDLPNGAVRRRALRRAWRWWAQLLLKSPPATPARTHCEDCMQVPLLRLETAEGCGAKVHGTASYSHALCMQGARSVHPKQIVKWIACREVVACRSFTCIYMCAHDGGTQPCYRVMTDVICFK
jgi:hypothetical protein